MNVAKYKSVINVVITILVVDDDKLIRWSLKEIFTQEGYEVDTASNAEDALNLAARKNYNFIFADVELNTESGIEMIGELQKISQASKIIIMSAYSKNQIEPYLEKTRVFSVMEKPFQAEEIKAIIKQATLS